MILAKRGNAAAGGFLSYLTSKYGNEEEEEEQKEKRGGAKKTNVGRGKKQTGPKGKRGKQVDDEEMHEGDDWEDEEA